jgi:hypothetical protein
MTMTVTTRALCAITLLCSAPAHAEQSRSGWFLGACVGTLPERRHCSLLSEQPLPEAVCNAMKDSLIKNGYPARVLCAPVLVDDDE